MKRDAHYLVSAAAFLNIPITIAFVNLTAWLAYKDNPWLSESGSWLISIVGLAFFGVAGMALGAYGAYLLLTRTPRNVAVPIVVLSCFPAMVAGAVYFRAMLVFLAIV